MALWSPAHRHACILPLTSPGPTLNYLNEEQRNVHIWNSQAMSRSPQGGATWFQLLASLWVDHKDRSLSASSLYRWLLSMCTHEGADPNQFVENTRNPAQHFFLFKLPTDPRRGGPFPTVDGDLNRRDLYEPIPPSQFMIQPGHYIMASVEQIHGQIVRKLNSFETHPPLITARPVSRTGTNTGGISRKDETRNSARSRDLMCRATGQIAPAGSRGYNFSGLEVAHVFPLAWAGQFRVAFPWDSNQERLYTRLGIPKFPGVKDIDILQNAFVLRGDVHTQFDHYQFAFETYINPETNRPIRPRLRVFEKDGAPSINNQTSNWHAPLGSGINDVDATLLTQHFLTALLWHVAGNGLNSTDNAIVPPQFAAEAFLGGHVEN
ncbi:hypothetical protein DFH09DRAFT_1221229 [Mycena vulgaris]|nr:hypothetical protein DFH09DRAFT_1221229 [Mycena vulgaris]